MVPANDYELFSPEIGMAGMALLVIVLDMFIERKGIVAALAFLSLGVPLGFTISLWNTEGTAFGGLFLVDQFSLFFKFLTIGVVGTVILASQPIVSRFKRFQGEYYALIMLGAAGLMLLAATAELITIYLSLELSSLAAIALVTFYKDNRSTEAGAKYLVLSAVASAVMLYGMAMIYGVTGSTKLDEIAQGITVTAMLDNPALLIGIVFMIAGFGFKISTFPFQMWVPDVYQGAPTPITAYLAVASKAAGFAVMLRVFYIAFPDVSLDWSMLFGVLAVISMSLGNLIAIFQSDIKRLLAYSAIAHAGYIMIGLAAVATRIPGEEIIGPEGVLFYLGGYAFTTLGAFFAVIAISHKVRSDAIDDYAGMGRRSPVLAGLLALAMISLTGLPPAIGFWGKLYLFNAAISADLVWLAVAGAINSVISAYYYLRVVKVMYLSPAQSEEAVTVQAPLSLALFMTSAGVLFFGIMPHYLLDFAIQATRQFPG